VSDIVVTESGGRALVRSLSHDAVEVILLDAGEVRPGDQFELREQVSQLYVGEQLLGRVINALGDPVDGKGALPPANIQLNIEKEAGDLARRAPITKQLVSGYSLVDTILPIGKGQRQLLMGPIQSGTETFCREVIRNQAGKNTICIYATIGKPVAYSFRLAEDLFKSEAKDYTIVLASSSDDGAPHNTIAPAVALLLAEYYSEEGKDVLVVLDDLYTHAKYLREIALLEGRLPGRESYPGDIFYQQAHLIERAGSFQNGGSITLLPLLQTDIESSTDLIMTNIMGTTDGHLQFSSDLFAQGTFPPVLEDESVTRVGKHAHTMVQKQLSTTLTTLLADAKAQERFTQFSSQVSEATKNIITMGSIIRLLLNQNTDHRLEVETQAILLALVLTTFVDNKDTPFFRANVGKLCACIASPECDDLREMVRSEKDFSKFLQAVEQKGPVFEKACHK
jgi:F-type H+-transporting ATPase subunit alpha